MKIINIKKAPTTVIFEVEVDQALWQKDIAAKKAALVKNVKVEGFRKGHVPLEIAEKYINMAEVLERAVKSAINKTVVELEEDEKFNEIDIELVSTPYADVKEVNADTAIFEFKYDVFPTVTVEGYKTLKLPKNEHENVSDEEVDKEISKYQRFKQKVEDKTEGELNKGDIAVFDFEGFKDGVAFAGGNAKNFELEIGTNRFVPGFEDQMVGMKIGETRELDITFPEEYQEKSLAGQKTVFKVTLNGMKTQIIPEVDEAFVADQKIEGVKTVAEFKEYVRNQLKQQFELNYQDSINSEIFKKLIEQVRVSHVPESLLREEKSKLLSMMEKQFQQQGFSLDDYLKFTNKSKEEFETDLTKQALDLLKYTLAIEKIAKEENITVSSEEVEEYLSKVAKVYNTTVEELKEKIKDNLEMIEEQLLTDKTIKQVIAWNK